MAKFEYHRTTPRAALAYNDEEDHQSSANDNPSPTDGWEADEAVTEPGVADDDHDFDAAFRRVTGKEQIVAFRWIIKGMIERGKAGILFGQNQSYKSFLIIAMAIHIMSGKWFAGRRTKAQGQAFIYVPFEGESSVNVRFGEAARALGIDPARLNMEVFKARPFGEKGAYEFFADGLRHYKRKWRDISMVVIDTVNQARFFDGSPGSNENDPVAWGKLYAFLKALAIELDVTIMLVHHAGKDMSAGGRGSSANTDDADFALTISAEKDQLTGVSVNHWLHQSKIKDGGSTGPICAIIPNEVDLGDDEDGDKVTTLTLSFDNDATYSPPDDGKGGSRRGESTRQTVKERKSMEAKYAEVMAEKLHELKDGENLVGGAVLRRAMVNHFHGEAVPGGARKAFDNAYAAATKILAGNGTMEKRSEKKGSPVTFFVMAYDPKLRQAMG